jgi:hypothetical protein
MTPKEMAPSKPTRVVDLDIPIQIKEKNAYLKHP